MDVPGKRYRSVIWIAGIDGGGPRPFTSSSSKDTAPRWSPDGTQLAFLSDRSGTTQLHVIPCDGGEARQISDLKHGVTDPLWSPDGSWIAVTSKIDPEGMVVLAEQYDAERDSEHEQSDVRVIRSLKYKRDGE
ncbi:MAG: PD40 domain-containing protein, partial [Thermomicrobiales bacterium]|nr:PD40 domain-containing protein [Thermomicrobiales bacterium]